MSVYRNQWIEVLKEQSFLDWHIDIHGQAIVIRLPDENKEEVEKKMPATISRLASEVQAPAEWLKFIFYNEKLLFHYVLNPELKDLR